MNRVSELFIVGFSGTELPAELRPRLHRGDFAGLVFFSRNFSAPTDPLATAEFLRATAAVYQPTLPHLKALPPILAIDHEGGRVQRLKAPLTVWPRMERLRAHPPALAEHVGRAMAVELAALGLNVNFAPVLDVNSNPQNPIIGDRAFGETAAAVSARALAFLRIALAVTDVVLGIAALEGVDEGGAFPGDDLRVEALRGQIEAQGRARVIDTLAEIGADFRELGGKSRLHDRRFDDLECAVTAVRQG